MICMRGLYIKRIEVSSVNSYVCNVYFLRNLFYLDDPKGSKKRCIFILGGFSTGDRFEFESVDQHNVY